MPGCLMNELGKPGKNIEPKADSPRRRTDTFQNEDTRKPIYTLELKPITVVSIASSDNSLSTGWRIQDLARQWATL